MKSIYDKYCDGDALSDKDVLKGMDEFKSAEEALLKLCPCFQIARKECNRVYYSLKSFAQARSLKF